MPPFRRLGTRRVVTTGFLTVDRDYVIDTGGNWWTREAVRDLIAQRFSVRVSVWTVGRYLKRWGFTPQKPLRRAYEQNPVAVARWLKEEYLVWSPSLVQMGREFFCVILLGQWLKAEA